MKVHCIPAPSVSWCGWRREMINPALALVVEWPT